MKKFNEASFCCDLSTAPWDSAFVYEDINDVWNHWSKLYKDIIDKHAPIVKKRVHANQLPWINVQIKRAIRLRNKLYRKYRLSQNDETWESYRVQRNLVPNLSEYLLNGSFWTLRLTQQLLEIFGSG